MRKIEPHGTKHTYRHNVYEYIVYLSLVANYICYISGCPRINTLIYEIINIDAICNSKLK